MNPNPKLEEMANALIALAAKIKNRIPAEGPILGWQGFHVELDEIDETTKALRLGVRGIFVSREEEAEAG